MRRRVITASHSGKEGSTRRIRLRSDKTLPRGVHEKTLARRQLRLTNLRGTPAGKSSRISDRPRQAAFFRDMAARDRAHAADARQRAKEWEDMAAKAQARAAPASGSLKESWEQIAKDDANSAKDSTTRRRRRSRKQASLTRRPSKPKSKPQQLTRPRPVPVWRQIRIRR